MLGGNYNYMLEELIKEIQELQEYKYKYECVQKDKQRMSDLLYEYMMREYESMGREERIISFRANNCIYCKYDDYCNASLPEDIWKPIPSKKAWIPGRKCCEKFEWS